MVTGKYSILKVKMQDSLNNYPLIKVDNEKTKISSQKYSKKGINWKKYVVTAPNNR